MRCLDFGARALPGSVQAARAAYDGAVASYRQTVLTAFQQVEDELAALRILESQYQVADQTVKDANLAVTLTLNQYRAGIVAYTAVVTAQAIALSDAQALLTVRQSRLVASVTLIQALGGGWSTQGSVRRTCGAAHATVRARCFTSPDAGARRLSAPASHRCHSPG